MVAFATAFFTMPVNAAPVLATAIKPVSRTTSAVSDAVQPSPSQGTTTPADSSTPADPVTQPVANTAAATVTPVTSIVDPLTQPLGTPIATSSPATPTLSVAQSGGVNSAATIETTATGSGTLAHVPSTVLSNTAAASSATANSQSLFNAMGINYGSHQISPQVAATLYKGASIAALGGFALYALSVLPGRPGRKLLALGGPLVKLKP